MLYGMCTTMQVRIVYFAEEIPSPLGQSETVPLGSIGP